MNRQQPVSTRLSILERTASQLGYSMRVDGLGMIFWQPREPKAGTFGEVHPFPCNDDGIEAAYNWLQWQQDHAAQ